MLFSIIIPMYNVQDYIERCVKSCERQNLQSQEYEVVIVNDGSSDNSLKIASSLASEFDNITIITKENGGLSSARNTGIKSSSGDYVWFVDSDDYIEDNIVGTISSICHNLDLDILSLSKANVVDDNIKYHLLFPSVKDGSVYSGKDAIRLSRMPNICAPYSVYKRSFLIQHSLFFVEGIFHEDNEFTPRAYYFAQKVSCVNKVCYYACLRSNSITSTVNPKRSYDLVKVANCLQSFSASVEKDYRYLFYRMIASSINEAMSFNPGYDNKTLSTLSKMLFENRSLFIYMIHSRRLKYFIEGVLFVLFPRRVLGLYSLLNKIKA